MLKVMTQWLRQQGFVVGARDPKMNTAHKGAFMVAERYDVGYSQPDAMGGDGVWCIVGDDLPALVRQAYDFFVDMLATPRDNMTETNQIRADSEWWCEAFGDAVIGFSFRNTATIQLPGVSFQANQRTHAFFMSLGGADAVDKAIADLRARTQS